jgi:addiction module HigA family antidote
VPFTPDYACPPGAIVEELLDAAGWRADDLAHRLGWTPSFTRSLLGGTTPITPAIATQLSELLGHTASFWLRCQSNYEADLERLSL